MDKLPLFLLLLKKNIIISAIIAFQSYESIDLSQINHVKWENGAIELKDFYLSPEDKFKSVMIGFSELGTDISFKTDDSKYFDNTRFYFERNAAEKTSHPYLLDSTEVRTNKKRLGSFAVFDPPLGNVSITVFKSTIYGYMIFLYPLEK